MARPRSFDTETALSAAEDQFRATGYAGTSVEAIGEATGLGRGSLYAAFGDKHELFTWTLRGYCQRNEEAITCELAGPDEDAIHRLQAFLARTALGAADEDSRVCVATKVSVELEDRDPMVAHEVSKLFVSIRSALMECVRAAQRNGDLDPTADPQHLADLIFAVSRGLDVLSRTTDRDTLAQVAETAFRSLPLTQAV
jgi:TetR/AcrR family transcriptional regulator, transcriptional repressor for nem operon